MFHEEYGAVLAYAAMRADLEVAKDAAAQTFVVAWRRRDELPDAPRAWLLGVTRRTLADSRRSQRRQEAVRSRLAGVEMITAEEVNEASAMQSDRELVGFALNRLTHTDAELLRLVYLDELSCREAAEILGSSVTATKVRLLRARRRFQRALEDLDRIDPGHAAELNVAQASTCSIQLPSSKEAP